MRMTFDVVYEDDPDTTHKVVAFTNDLAAMEDKFDVSVVEGDFNVGQLLWLVWHALHRRGNADADFDTWSGRGVDIEPVNEATAVPVGVPGEENAADGDAVGEPEAGFQPPGS